MDYKDAGRELLVLMAKAREGLRLDDEPLAAPGRAAAALEAAGAVHAEALLASLTAFVQAQDNQVAGATSQALTPAGAALQELPEQTIELDLDFPLTKAQLEQLLPDHVPNDGWDRWFVTSEEDGAGAFTLRYYRNASGYCFFVARVEPAAGAGTTDGEIRTTETGEPADYLVRTVIVNQDDKQYSETKPEACAAQLKILLACDLGLDDEPYWDALDY